MLLPSDQIITPSCEGTQFGEDKRELSTQRQSAAASEHNLTWTNIIMFR
jgi:hypothetical protein